MVGPAISNKMPLLSGALKAHGDYGQRPFKIALTLESAIQSTVAKGAAKPNRRFAVAELL